MEAIARTVGVILTIGRCVAVTLVTVGSILSACCVSASSESPVAIATMIAITARRISPANNPYSKPHPKIFDGALKLADCSADRAVMVGDHLDKDIAGAKQIGMLTIRARQGIYAEDEPSNPDEIADAEITGIRQLPRLLL